MATVSPINVRDDGVIWTSSDESVATVNADGVVTGVSTGTCVITATSVLDETRTATCQVSIETIAYTLKGMLKDTNGKSMSYTWNVETEPTWSKVAEVQIDGIGSTALTSNGVYTMNTDLFDRYVHLFDPETGKELSQPWRSSDNLWDMTQSKMFSEKNGKDYLAYMESYFLFVPSSPENFSTSAWVFRKYFEQAGTGASHLMTIAANGVRGENEYGAYEEFLLLDDAGYMWIADIYDSLSMGHAMVPTTLPAYSLHDNVYNYCSMVVADDGMVFVSIYTGEGSVLYMLELRTNREGEEYYDAVEIGSVGDNVASASLYLATANHQEEGQAAATAQIERTEPVQASSVSAEELAAREAPARPQSTAAKDRDRGYHRAGMPMAWRLRPTAAR